MLHSWLKKATPTLAGAVIALAMLGWAVPIGAAHLSRAVFRLQRSKSGPQRTSTFKIPRPIYFRAVDGRGLLVDLWINGTGPYTFAIDTGAGATMMSTQVAAEAGVTVNQSRSHRIIGLSGVANNRRASESQVRSLAIGDSENYLPAKGTILTADIFPHGIDGVLDPTESYSPLGYVIDFPRNSLSAFDPGQNPLRTNRPPVDGAVVNWISEAGSRRPYVLLDDGRRALLDTGSEFGLAVRDNTRVSSRANRPSENRVLNDLGGGSISARRVAPQTVAIGALALQNIPTDLVSGLDPGAPVLLGRAALQPFRVSFDPISRLIEIAPASR